MIQILFFHNTYMMIVRQKEDDHQHPNTEHMIQVSRCLCVSHSASYGVCVCMYVCIIMYDSFPPNPCAVKMHNYIFAWIFFYAHHDLLFIHSLKTKTKQKTCKKGDCNAT